jgi:hypothetical protein
LSTVPPIQTIADGKLPIESRPNGISLECHNERCEECPREGQPLFHGKKMLAAPWDCHHDCHRGE